MVIECIVDESLIGDALCTLPFILYQATQDAVYVTGEFSPPAKDLCHGMPIIFSAPPVAADKVYRLKASNAWQWTESQGWHNHMSQGHFGVNGYPLPEMRSLNFSEHECDLTPGMVISPFARSDGLHHKRWAQDRWIELINLCKDRVPVYVVGAKNDDMEPFWQAGATPIQGWHLSHILGLLRKSKVFVSIDTGTSHIAGLSGLRNHVLLYPSLLPDNWTEYKTSTVLKAKFITDISVDRVYSEVRKYI